MELVALLFVVVLLGSGAAMVAETVAPRAALGYRNGVGFTVQLESIGGGHWLAVQPARSFRAMRDAAKSVGVELPVNSSFREMTDQRRLYELYIAGKGNLAAKPGYSNHQAGESVDIDTGGLGRASAVYAWLSNNAARFGFVNDVASEPWHWTFKGVV